MKKNADNAARRSNRVVIVTALAAMIACLAIVGCAAASDLKCENEESGAGFAVTAKDGASGVVADTLELPEGCGIYVEHDIESGNIGLTLSNQITGEIVFEEDLSDHSVSTIEAPAGTYTGTVTATGAAGKVRVLAQDLSERGAEAMGSAGNVSSASQEDR